ncbi:MAG: hypothetical protein AB1439_04250 [candidate division FCPU426 bacterium]
MSPVKEAARVITAVLYRGASAPVLKALRRAGVNTAVACHARGSSVADQTPLAFEKEVLTVLIEARRADEIFDLIGQAAKVDRPHGAFLYMSRASRRTAYPLPPVGEESVE